MRPPIKKYQEYFKRKRKRNFLFFAILSVAIGLLVLFVVFTRQLTETPPVQTSSTDSASTALYESSAEKKVSARQKRSFSKTTGKPTKTAATKKQAGAEQSVSQKASATLSAKNLVAGLLLMSEEALTPEGVDEINRILRALIAEGEAALPAIRQFLESGQDLSFIGLMDDADLVGYGSLRIRLFDVLRQIGGTEAEDIMLAELLKIRDPPEILTLAEFLEELAPGAYRQDALDTALETLDVASEIQLNAKDAGSLFQLLQAYGDARVVSDLERNLDPWGYYAMLVLTGFPEGEGIPALVDLVNQRPEQNPDDPPVLASDIYLDKSLFALQMLAQAAVKDADAHAALIDQTGSNRIPDSLWSKIGLALAGQYQFQIKKPDNNLLAGQVTHTSFQPKTYPHVIAENGQIIYIRNSYGLGKLPPEEIDARIGLIDELISVSQSVAANRALNHARSMLMANKANK